MANATTNNVRIVDGSVNFLNGVDSSKTTTAADNGDPAGLKRTELFWSVNATMRGGGIYQRTGWQPRLQNAPWSGLWQGGWLYEPAEGFPYFVVQVGGRIYKVEIIPNYVVTDLSAAFGLTNPATVEQAFFCQGEIFLVIQAGDYTTLPLFWDGTTLRRSNGILEAAGPIYNMTFPSGFTVPAGPLGTQFTVTSSAPYGGSTGDVIAFTLSNSYSIGNFIVKNIAGNVTTLETTTNRTGATSSSGTWQWIVQTTIVPEIPAAGPMDYYFGRLWYAFGRSFTAGDIVFGPSGTAAYGRLDSILKVTENSVAVNGDGFRLPSNAGNIRAMFHTQELNSQTGEGRLYISTRKVVYRLDVPVTRDDWTNAGDGTGGTQNPFITVVQLNYGAVSDRCVVQAASDIFYQTLEPAIRSLELSIRNFGQWGSTGISTNERRVLDLNNRELLHVATGIQCFNRMYQSALPFRTAVGIAHQAICVLDFDLITTLDQKFPPAWEGIHEGLDWLQLFEGDFGGLQKAFGFIVSRTTGAIELWEMTLADKRDDGDKRIQMMIETPSYTWGNVFSLKRLETIEIWYDKLFGALEVEVYYRPDQHSCWIPWDAFTDCAARDCTEDLAQSAGCSGSYPNQAYCEQFRATKVLPIPPEICLQQSGRPANLGYQFQIKILSRGSWRIRGLLLHAIPVAKQPFDGLTC